MDGLRKIFYSENAEEEGNEISFHELFKLILESTEYFMEKIVTACYKFKIHLVQKTYQFNFIARNFYYRFV